MKKIDAFDYAGQICKAMKPNGILLTTKVGEQVNTMTIGWGTMGVEWGRPLFIAYVRESRFTHQMIEQSGEFTVNIPMGDVDKKILAFCGTRSGRDTDKLAELGLHTVASQVVAAPGIRELPLTLECRVIYHQEQPLDAIPADILARYYPNGDHHHVYYGEIVNAYLIES